MTIEQIREKIHVSGYGLYDRGLRVVYKWYGNRNDKGDERNLVLMTKEAIEELKSIGEIETDDWEWIADNYVFNQWAALNMVIRYEHTKAIEQEIDNSDIGKAINNLLK